MFEIGWSISPEVRTFIPWLCVLLISLLIMGAALVLFVKKWLLALPGAIVAFFVAYHLFDKYVVYGGRLEDIVLAAFLFFVILFGQQWQKWNG